MFTVDEQGEKELISRAKAGDDEAFTTLFRANYSFLYKYFIKLCFDPELTKDLIQETMLKAYVHLRSFRGKAKFSTWLISIGSRTYLDEIRKQQKEERRMQAVLHETKRKLMWSVRASGHEWTEQMALILELKPDARIPLLLKDYYGYSYKEIATILNMKEGTVKSRVHYARQKVRREWLE